MLWLESVSLQMPDKLGRRHRRDENSENCGILPAGEDQQSGEIDENKSLESQIVGGEISKSKWPWMVGLILKGRLFCGATVIDDRHVITAAHCFLHPGNDTEQFTVQVGELSHGDPSTHYKIEDLKIHEGFTGEGSFFNDIAILRLDSQLPSDVTPLCLPTEDALKEGDQLTILGWGAVNGSNDSELSDDLKEIRDISFALPEQCLNNLGIKEPLGKYQYLLDSLFCSAKQEDVKGPCKGDSGGPVMHQNQDGQFELVGLMLSVIECGLPLMSGVYTKVFFYLPWIRQVVGEGENED